MGKFLAALALALASITTSAVAQTASSKPMRIVVGYPPGGISDIMSRLIATSLSKTLDRPVIVENRPGASGLIATRAVQAAPADGDTLLWVPISFVGLPYLQKGVNYDPAKDFAPVAIAGESPGFLMVNDSVPAKTVAELIAYAKTLPKGLDAATAGPSSGTHIMTMLLAKMANINLVPIAYKGGSEALTALLSGEVKMQLSNSTGAVAAQVKAGKLRFLATSSEQPTSLAPGLPTINQTVPGYVFEGWYGFVTTAGAPPAKIAAISAGIKKALTEPALRDALAAAYVEPKYADPAEFASAIARTDVFWKKIVSELNMTPQ